MALFFWDALNVQKNIQKPNLDPASSNQMSFKTTSNQGTNWTLIFLILPAISIVWAIVDKVKLPNNELAYLKYSTQVGFYSYVIFWILSFYRTHRDKNLFLISLFLLGLWLLSSFFLIAKINIILDQSPIRVERSKVIRSVTVSGGKNSRGYCIAYTVNPIDGMEKVDLQKSYCEDLTSGHNGIEVHFREGALGLPYKVDSLIIKDYDFYMKKIH